MIGILSKFSNWKIILPLFVLFGIIAFYLLPSYQAKLSEMVAEEFTPLDLRISYTPEEVNSMFERLGHEGRDVYKFVVGRIDMIYPVIYGLLFILVLAYLLKKLNNPGSKFILIAWLPIAGVLFDYLENFNTLKLLAQFPDLSVQSVSWGEQMTRAKHGFLFLSVGLVIFFMIALLIKKLMKRNKT